MWILFSPPPPLRYILNQDNKKEIVFSLSRSCTPQSWGDPLAFSLVRWFVSCSVRCVSSPGVRTHTSEGGIDVTGGDLPPWVGRWGARCPISNHRGHHAGASTKAELGHARHPGRPQRTDPWRDLEVTAQTFA